MCQQMREMYKYFVLPFCRDNTESDTQVAHMPFRYGRALFYLQRVCRRVRNENTNDMRYAHVYCVLVYVGYFELGTELITELTDCSCISNLYNFSRVVIYSLSNKQYGSQTLSLSHLYKFTIKL